jgi:hypothetical protein
MFEVCVKRVRRVRGVCEVYVFEVCEVCVRHVGGMWECAVYAQPQAVVQAKKRERVSAISSLETCQLVPEKVALCIHYAPSRYPYFQLRSPSCAEAEP